MRAREERAPLFLFDSAWGNQSSPPNPPPLRSRSKSAGAFSHASPSAERVVIRDNRSKLRLAEPEFSDSAKLSSLAAPLAALTLASSKPPTPNTSARRARVRAETRAPPASSAAEGAAERNFNASVPPPTGFFAQRLMRTLDGCMSVGTPKQVAAVRTAWSSLVSHILNAPPVPPRVDLAKMLLSELNGGGGGGGSGNNGSSLSPSSSRAVQAATDWSLQVAPAHWAALADPTGEDGPLSSLAANATLAPV